MALYPKLFTYLDYGAPTLNGQVGSLINLLDAVLLTGYGTRTMGTLTQTGGIAQATVGSNHGLLPGQVLLIAGADQAAYNGEQKILNVGFNTVTFAVPSGTVSPATGTITFKFSPLGWTKPFSNAGSYLAVYRCASPQYIGTYLRVDDNPTVYGFTNRVARVHGYESMTDVNTGSGIFPTSTLLTSPVWMKSDTNGQVNARPWAILGDDRCFYFWSCPNIVYTPNSNGFLSFFGDLDAAPGIDGFATCLDASGNDNTTSGSGLGDDVAYSVFSASYAHFFPRPPNGLGGAVRAARAMSAPIGASGGYSGTNVTSGLVTYPNGADNSLLLHPVLNFSSGALRGAYPGLQHCSQSLGTTSFASMQVIDGARNFAGRKLIYLPCSSPGTAYSGGGVFFDLTGPWRQY